MKQMTLAELAALVGGRLQGDGARTVTGVASLESAGATDVAFLANPKYERQIESTAAAAVLVAADYAGPTCPSGGLVRCADPYFAFRQTMMAFHGLRRPHFSGIDSRAAIDPTAALGAGVNVAAFVTVAAGASIGERTVLYPGAYVGPNCRIGRDCTLYPNVTLYDGTILGDRVTVHAGSSIGHDGFGYATHRCDDGVVRHDKIPQAGWVVLEDDVEIGACCAIDRATMGATVVGAGTKFSNLVAIGHGTQLGKHCLLVAQSGIAGSVMVGNYCVFAGQAGVVGHIRIGDGAKIGAQCGVTNDIPAGQDTWGTPAMPLAQARRAFATIQHLPELRSAVRKLLREVNSIKRSLGHKTSDEGGA
jgi:UDP-3-O-[3-hydroxymyristoyl] glucosamine N-acyltransferase